MIFFQIKKDSDIYYSNVPDNIDSFPRKVIQREYSDYSLEIIATEKDILLFGSERHRRAVTVISENLIQILDQLEERQNNRYTILSHNLITTHAHLQDIVENIVPAEKLAQAKDHFAQLEIAKNYLIEDTEASADALLGVIKRVVDLQAQIEGFKILSKQRKLDLGDHNILKVLENIIHPFYQDFLSNNIDIKWHIDSSITEKYKLRTDFKVINVILHHLLTNAVKYTRPYSCIDINYYPENRELVFSMRSIRIEQDEIEKIFDLQYCGKNVPQSLAGEGVGMYMVRKAADLIGIQVKVQPDFQARIEEIESVKYTPNKFKLKFPVNN